MRYFLKNHFFEKVQYSILFMLLVFVFSGCNQHFMNSALKPTEPVPQTIYLDTDTGRMRFTAVTQNNGKVREKYMYTWYKYNTIHHTFGGYDGRVLDGEYAEFYKNGNLLAKGDFRDGVKIGKWRRWHPNGQIKEIANYKRGLKNGKAKIFYSTGVIQSKLSYKNGLGNGKSKVFASNGSLVNKSGYKNGLKNGLSVDFDGDTVVSSVLYKNGIIVGKEEEKKVKDKKYTWLKIKLFFTPNKRKPSKDIEVPKKKKEVKHEAKVNSKKEVLKTREKKD